MAQPEIVKDIDARIIRPTSTDNAIVRFDGVAGQVQNSLPLIDDNGNITAQIFIGSLQGNAATATKLQTARTISLTGDVTGSGTFDGSGNLSITATVADNSHSHSYLPLAGGTLTGYLSLGNNSNTSTIPAAGIRIPDLRECTPMPGMFGDRTFNIYFDQAATGDWQSIIHIKGWTGAYVAYELAGPASTSNYNQGLYYRAGVSGSWQCSWKKLWMQGDAVTGSLE